MKILVYAYDLVVAGVTVNAIELAAALRDLHGHDVVLFAAPGPMQSLVAQHGLRYLPAPPAYQTIHPSPTRVRALREAVRQEQPDLIHAWDWAQCVDAFFVEHLLMQVPMVVTDMCMGVQRMLPKNLPTTFGTPEVLGWARAKGHRKADYLLPPVDVHRNAPGAVDTAAFRAQHQLDGSQTVLVTVSRLDTEMKSESLFRTIDAVRQVGREAAIKLLIVGDGDARGALEALADRVNAELGRPAVVFTGALIDPRPAYAAADIVIGMGGSALRAMAFGKPVLAVGEGGFSDVFSPATADLFLHQGIYGLADGDSGNLRLAGHLRALLERADQLPELGRFSREFVCQHHALDVVSQRLSDFCVAALQNQPHRHLAALDGLRTAAVWLRERRFMPSGWSGRRWLSQTLRLPRKSLAKSPAA